MNPTPSGGNFVFPSRRQARSAGGAGNPTPAARGWEALAWAVAALAAVPAAMVALAMFTASGDVWHHMWSTRLPGMLRNTLVLLLGVGIGTLTLGVGLAWLVKAYRFPGRQVFDRLLILPLAMPGYVLAFVLMATLDYAGPVQTALRGWLGPQLRLPEIRSAAGAVSVMTLVLYPYVYLLARAAFQEQSAATLEAARALGYSRIGAFFRLALPMARPSIVAGLTLALMEALTDFGVVRLYNFPTLTDGVFRIWHGMMDRKAATELAGLLLLFALAIILLERRLRGGARFHQTGGRGIEAVDLTGWKGWAAVAACSVVLASAFLIPVAQLVMWAAGELGNPMPGTLDALYWRFLRNSLVLTGWASIAVLVLVLALAYAIRLSGTQRTRHAARLATMGYAMPGAVVAMGTLVTLANLDHALNGAMQSWIGTTPGLLLTGSTLGLIYAYAVRFMAVGYNGVEASLEKVTPNMDGAARTLGATASRIAWQIHLPLISAGMVSGAILVFLDTMKELPITLLLRPFGYDTLAVWLWQMVSESMWSGAALPALTIVLAGLLPVAFLMRAGAPSNGHAKRATTFPRISRPRIPSRALGLAAALRRDTGRATASAPPSAHRPEESQAPGEAAAMSPEFSPPIAPSRPAILLEGISKRFSETTALDQVSLSVEQGELLALVGPSGCGKTTLLRVIAGLEAPDAGRVYLWGQLAVGPGVWTAPEARKVGLVFQDYALFPHMTVAANVAFGLRTWDRETRRRRIDEVLELVRLTHLARRYPHELSGGQQQRVALARALAPRPKALLLDEPFSNLDSGERARVREEIKQILKKSDATAMFVTHDQEEALFMGDRVAVLSTARIEQVGTPEELYTAPASRFVAEFMGPTEFIPGQVTPQGVHTEIGLLPQQSELPPGIPVAVAIRADDVVIEPDQEGPAVVVARHFKGTVNVYRVRLPSGRTLHSLQPHTLNLKPGTRVRVRAEPGHALAVFPESD